MVKVITRRPHLRSHKLTLALAGVLVSWFLLLGLAQAAEFSADVITRTAGQEINSKIYVKGDKIRMEIPSPLGAAVSILRLDKKVMWMQLPGQKLYTEMPFDRQAFAKALNMPDKEANKKLVGTEKLHGFDTEKYIMSGKDGQGTVWIAKKLGVPIGFESADQSIRQDYQNIKLGGVRDRLFEMPAGYKKMNLKKAMRS